MNNIRDEFKRRYYGTEWCADYLCQFIGVPNHIYEGREMTEQEWLTSNSPRAMLEFLRYGYYKARYETDKEKTVFYDNQLPELSYHKLCLFIAAAEREWWGDNLNSYAGSEIIKLEAIADGKLSPNLEVHLSYRMCGDPMEDYFECVRIHNNKGDPPRWANLLRDIFGNPWKPVEIGVTVRAASQMSTAALESGASQEWIPPNWLSWNGGIIPRMAQEIYDRRTFEDMPMLADALEEAGCENKEILMHCRNKKECPDCLGKGAVVKTVTDDWGPPYSAFSCTKCNATGLVDSSNTHVRGCWVLDLLLGKV